MKRPLLPPLPEPSLLLQAVMPLLLLVWLVWLLAQAAPGPAPAPGAAVSGTALEEEAPPSRPWPRRPKLPAERDFFRPLPPKPAAEKAVAPPADHLLGVVRRAGVWMALLERGGRRAWLGRGEKWVEGWVLRSLTPRKVVLRRGKKDGERLILRLPGRVGSATAQKRVGKEE